MSDPDSPARAVVAEGLGSLMLTATVVGSGILATRLAGGNDAVALLGNAAATGAILYVLITALGPVSGAHFNPAVTLVMALRGALTAGRACAYCLVQIVGCCVGTLIAHAMFELPAIQEATRQRSSTGELLGELMATAALIFTILAISRTRPQAVATAVAAVIVAGYWWTSSTSFANPAITLARALTDTFAGIRLADAPGFIVSQLLGAGLGLAAAGWLYGSGQDKSGARAS